MNNLNPRDGSILADDVILSNFSISSGSGLIIKRIVLLWESTQLEGYGQVGIEHKINIFRDQDLLLKYTEN